MVKPAQRRARPPVNSCDAEDDPNRAALTPAEEVQTVRSAVGELLLSSMKLLDVVHDRDPTVPPGEMILRRVCSSDYANEILSKLKQNDKLIYKSLSVIDEQCKSSSDLPFRVSSWEAGSAHGAVYMLATEILHAIEVSAAGGWVVTRKALQGFQPIDDESVRTTTERLDREAARFAASIVTAGIVPVVSGDSPSNDRDWFHPAGAEVPDGFKVGGIACGPVIGNMTELGFAMHPSKGRREDKTYQNYIKRECVKPRPRLFVKDAGAGQFEAFFRSNRDADAVRGKIEVFQVGKVKRIPAKSSEVKRSQAKRASKKTDR